jgi:hypothetical protein
MNIEDIAKYYISTPAYEVPSDVVRNFRQFVIDLAQVELPGIEFQFVDFQPYVRGTKLCLQDIFTDYNQRRLLISNQFNESDLLGPEINMIFRCIHDLHHLKLNVDFNWQGECASTRHIMSFTDNFLFKQLLFSEILGQSAVCLAQGQFPSYQKVVLFEPNTLNSLVKTAST